MTMSGKQILIVDDAVTVRQLVKIALGKGGFQVTEAVDGADGLTKANGGQFDLVITDLNMPNKNGLELAKDLRGTDQYAKTPIFMMTTESSQDVAMQGKQIGVTAWIVKPFKPDQLITAINKVLGL
jgi:two-component system chemotaxis response regulator CheY